MYLSPPVGEVLSLETHALGNELLVEPSLTPANPNLSSELPELILIPHPMLPSTPQLHMVFSSVIVHRHLLPPGSEFHEGRGCLTHLAI